MKISLLILISLTLIWQGQTLVRRQQLTHDLTRQVASHQIITPGEIINYLMIIGILAVVVGVGVCCFCFRGILPNSSDDSRAPIVQNTSQRRQVRVANIPPLQLREEYKPVRQQNTNNNAILDYFSTQKNQGSERNYPQKHKEVLRHQNEAIKDSNNPYLTTKGQSSLLKWDGVHQTSMTSCAICNLFNKNNSIPIVQVECIEDHCFHMKCISEYRSNQVVQKAGNGLNKCPKCKQNYSPVVRIYCPSCKNTTISINLINFSCSKGQINTDLITSKYGFVCQNCRKN